MPVAWCTSAVVGQGESVQRHRLAVGARLQVQQEQGGRVGIGPRLGQLGSVEHAGGIAVEVKHPDVDGTHAQGEREDGGHPGCEGAVGERRPTARAGRGEIGLEHRATRPGGVHARALAQAELQFLQLEGGAVGRRHGPGRTLRRHQRQPHAAHRERPGTGVHEAGRQARPVGGTGPDGSKDLGDPDRGHANLHRPNRRSTIDGCSCFAVVEPPAVR
jgi:hypothetical protein